MYGSELIRNLCAEISETKDEKKTEELLSLLRAVVSDELEEARTRTTFLRQKYPSVSHNKTAA
jgi:ribosome-interacting GTPase 1